MFQQIKNATVALVLMHKESLESDSSRAPFTIFGTGFCIHPRGVIVTCEHVLSAFMRKSIRDIIDQLPESDEEGVREIEGVEMATPHVLFLYPEISKENLILIPTQPDIAMVKTNYDLGIIRVAQHNAFPDGFPTAEIESYDQVKEGIEVATCGFPLGNYLSEQIGTMTSSFTRGIVSSIIPAQGVPLAHLKGFQLNLTATNGNSGGPVFSLTTGKVFGVLERGVVHPNGTIIQGLIKAEPIYPMLEHNLVERIVAAEPHQIPVLE